MFDRRKIEYTYLKLSKKIKDFLLSDKSREFLTFFIFLLDSRWILAASDFE